MDARERAIAMRELARMYHQWGINIVPLGPDKRPVITGVSRASGKPLRFLWEDWAETPQTDSLFAEILRPAWWGDVYGIAGICGPVSGNLVCIDFDATTFDTVAGYLGAAGLPESYSWLVKSPGGGWHIWVRTQQLPELDKGKLRRPAKDGVGFVEFRWHGHYTALPGTTTNAATHPPTGGVYAWVNVENQDMAPGAIMAQA